jgi:hypothetical protein
MLLWREGEELPGSFLRVGRVKIGEKLLVRHFPFAAGIVSHGILDSGQVVNGSEVAMLALVEGSLLEEGGSSSGRCGRPFGLPGNCRSVVAASVGGFPGQFEAGGRINHMVSDGTGKLQVGISDGTMRVLLAH